MARQVVKPEALELLRDLNSKPVAEQAKAFLRTFILDFKGNFEEILNLAEYFITFRTRREDDGEVVVCYLEEADLYRFLEAQGHPISAAEFRVELREIDIDTDRRVTFIEYCIWKYKKAVNELIVPPGEADPALLRALEEAINMYQKVVDERNAREKKIAQLRHASQQGGVKGNIAKAELDQILAADQLERNRQELTAAAKRRAAQKAVESDKDGSKARERAMREEEARLIAEKKKKEEEERKVKEASRAKLAQKAKLFEGVVGEQAAAVNPSPKAAVKKFTPSGGAPSGGGGGSSGGFGGPSSGSLGGPSGLAAILQAQQQSQQSQYVAQPPPQPIASSGPPSFAPPPTPPPSVPQCRGLHDYVGRSATELSFQAGDIINVITKDPGGWWEGELRGARGWLPSNFVQEI